MRQNNLFRAASLKRLSDPEDLDRTLTVVTTKAWVATVTLAAMVAAIVVWSFEGEVPTYVKSQGILLNRDGKIFDAATLGSGVLTNILTEVGDTVEQGSIIAEIANSEATERYRSALALVEERTIAVAELKMAMAAEDELIVRNVEQQRQRLEQLERNNRTSVEKAYQRLEDYRQLFEEHIVTRAAVERSQNAYDQAQRELFSTLRQRDDLEATEIRRQTERRVRISEAEARQQAAERQANELEALINTQHIAAPVSGLVIEIKATIGTVLQSGQPVLSIETGQEQLEMLVYLPAAEGKRVEPGMEVLVSPATVRREEYGAIRGVVEYVSPFPASLESMIATLQNRALARTIAANGAPYAGRVKLLADPETVSGLAWTSPKAAEKTISVGTLATAEVKVESQSPITLVVPLIRETLGL